MGGKKPPFPFSEDVGATFTRIYNNGIACVYVDADTVYAGGRNSGNNHAKIWRLDYAGNLQGAALDPGFNGVVEANIKNILFI